MARTSSAAPPPNGSSGTGGGCAGNAEARPSRAPRAAGASPIGCPASGRATPGPTSRSIRTGCGRCSIPNRRETRGWPRSGISAPPNARLSRRRASKLPSTGSWKTCWRDSKGGGFTRPTFTACGTICGPSGEIRTSPASGGSKRGSAATPTRPTRRRSAAVSTMRRISVRRRWERWPTMRLSAAARRAR